MFFTPFCPISEVFFTANSQIWNVSNVTRSNELFKKHKITHLEVKLCDPDGDVELIPEPVEGVLHLGQVDGIRTHVTLSLKVLQFLSGT